MCGLPWAVRTIQGIGISSPRPERPQLIIAEHGLARVPRSTQGIAELNALMASRPDKRRTLARGR